MLSFDKYVYVQDSTRMGHASFSTRQNPNLIELPIVFAVSLIESGFPTRVRAHTDSRGVHNRERIFESISLG